MTTHYTIHSPTTGRTLKVSYKGGKFFRLEKVSGKAFKDTDIVIMAPCIPPTEEEIPQFQLAYKTLDFTKEEKTASIYQQYVGAWFSFYENHMTFPPKFTKADGMALNQIKAYLTKVSGSEAEGLALFTTVLDSWHKLEDFHKQNTDLKYINSRLNVILNAVKKTGQAGTGGTDNSVRF